MNVHIDGLRIDIENQEIARLLITGDELIVASHHRLVKIWVAHIPPIDEEELLSTSFARMLGFSHKTMYANKRGLDIDRDELLLEVLAHHGRNAL